MKTATLSALALLLAAVATAAADAPKGPPLDTSFLKLYAETRGFMLGRPQKPTITPDGKAVLFLRSEAKTPKLKLYEFNVATGKTKELLSPESLLKGADEDLTPEEKGRRERQRITVGGFADYHLDKDGKRVLVKLSNRLYVLDRETGKVTELKTGTEGAIVDPKWSPDGRLIAYVRGYDVYVYDLAAEKESAVTTGGTQVKTHGLAEFVAQEEMGRFSGYWWSPDSKSIAYTEADHTGVEQWHIADPLKPDVPPSPQYYPRPGKKNVSVRLGVKPIEGGGTVWIEWDRKKWEYLSAVRWDEFKRYWDSPGSALGILLQDRKQQFMSLSRFDSKSGKLFPLADAMDPGWVNLPTELPRADAEGFLWAVTDRGQTEFQLRDWQEGRVQMVVVPRSEKPEDVVSVNSQAVVSDLRGGVWYGTIVFTSSPDPTQRQIRQARVEVNRGGPLRGQRKVQIEYLTSKSGLHTAVVSQMKDSTDTLTVITTTTLQSLPEVRAFKVGHHFDLERIPNPNPPAREAKLTSLGTLPSIAIEPPFKPNVTIEKVGDYWTAIVRPRNFDPKKKYPVVVDVYGGPKHLHVVQAMRNWLVPQWLADQGFIVVAIDNRGTPGRGRDWEKAIYQKFGTVPIEDQVKGLHALCDKYPELDRDRVGIVGWSFGGYNAANGVLRRPDVFKAAVAGAPVTDWEDYDTHYTERYLGLLPESQKAYDDANLIPLAKDLKRPLLLVHGTADDNVYYRHTLKLADALFRAGKDFEMLPLPGITHMYSADPVVMERLWAKTATFFKEHLGEAR
jgi:dipeptidyl-peptidase-4